MTAFGVAINAIFADPNMSVPAEYRAGGADPAVSVRVMKSSPSVVSDWNSASIVQDSVLFDVRVSEIATPAIGDTFTISGTIYSVIDEPLLDAEGLIWQLGMRDGA